MLPQPDLFYIRGEDGEEYGPADLEELREWVRENRAGIGTEVRRNEPGGTWNDWRTYPELIALLAEVSATGNTVPGAPALIVAPLGRRVAAFGIDLALVFVLWIPLMVTFALVYMPDFCGRFVDYYHTVGNTPPGAVPPPFQPTQDDETRVSMVYTFLLLLYMGGFNIAHGQTPAKALLRLRVVDQAGKKPGPIKTLARTIILIVSMNLFFVPLLYVFFNPQRRALHDLIVGTYVVET